MRASAPRAGPSPRPPLQCTQRGAWGREWLEQLLTDTSLGRVVQSPTGGTAERGRGQSASPRTHPVRTRNLKPSPWERTTEPSLDDTTGPGPDESPTVSACCRTATLLAKDWFSGNATEGPVPEASLCHTEMFTSYAEAKCQAALRELRQCCARLPKGRSLVCSGFEREEESLAPKPLRSDVL
ncbi:PREDICTED: uncharacterized protein LOC101624535 isoform X1 [Condylura cristata]|uniref:uncharacterized protein LOC101624535 isoform X1 n=1 Tax=Condylura cristata TaxID=143302 RepID=UPI0006429223|nr:PREDICTED: uncharacterized protein LOC101624535 isoform X1 [Condylura cristata]